MIQVFLEILVTGAVPGSNVEEEAGEEPTATRLLASGCDWLQRLPSKTIHLKQTSRNPTKSSLMF